ncbi:sigma-70 family RNA polymerase sigma factor [Haliangium ochraceum]|uniref:RNA polymerase, sigma 28 subunit, FliA/WhiG subfamily n=1 Tax=Haliangium ochraceum (strain DSM 14365 / JCM 11303 / SMP-2) TaxID=502025 RepID=D0LLA7_HALO1|nr:RNA polymerase sigma factor FliA [Haliangium ochraceum]ACY18603.1 RNA polymerase, sigma 28 subunit, FliA/WhiG subfamily [Haliangium ochraceum DSM 14365]
MQHAETTSRVQVQERHRRVDAAARKREHCDELIKEHIELALSMARRMARRLPASVCLDDIESAALLGLTEAARRYDDKRREPFMGFAAKRIRGAILDQLRRSDMLTRRGRRAARQVAEAARSFEGEHGRPATDSELADQLGVSDEEFHSVYASVRDVTVTGVDDADAILPDDAAATFACIERQQLRAALVRALEKLDDRARVVLAAYYQDGLTLREIGQILGITESRVCQIHTQTLALLRDQLS